MTADQIARELEGLAESVRQIHGTIDLSHELSNLQDIASALANIGQTDLEDILYTVTSLGSEIERIVSDIESALDI